MKVLFRIASGLYPCLWCHIRQEQMSVPREEWCVSQVLTMEGIKKDYQRFIEHGGGALNKARPFYNVRVK